MKNIMFAITAVLNIPLMIMNWTAVLIGAVWLLFKGEWLLVVSGVISIVVVQFIIGIVMMPALGIGILALKSRYAVMRYPLFAISFVLNLIVICLMVIASFNYYVGEAHGTVWPYALWAYAVATIPWVQFARGENNTGTVTWLAAVQIGALGVFVSIVTGVAHSLPDMAIFFLPSSLIGMAVTAWAQKELGR
jgi:hypothetical protein